MKQAAYMNNQGQTVYFDTLEQINNNEVYQQVLKDSFGGVMYDVANYGKYDSSELLNLWDSLSANEQSAAGGIMKGAMHFLKGNN